VVHPRELSVGTGRKHEQLEREMALHRELEVLAARTGDSMATTRRTRCPYRTLSRQCSHIYARTPVSLSVVMTRA